MDRGIDRRTREVAVDIHLRLAGDVRRVGRERHALDIDADAGRARHVAHRDADAHALLALLRHLHRHVEAVRIAGIGQQLLRLGDVRRIELQRLVEIGMARRDRAEGRLALAEQRELDDRVLVDRQRERLAHAHIVERRPLVVEDHAVPGRRSRRRRRARSDGS